MSIEEMTEETADREMILFDRNYETIKAVLWESPRSDFDLFREPIREIYDNIIRHYRAGLVSDKEMEYYESRRIEICHRIIEAEERVAVPTL